MKHWIPVCLVAMISAHLVGCRTAHRSMSASPTAMVSLAEGQMETSRSDRMLIWRAWLSIEVGVVSDAMARVESIAEQSGGYIESKSSSSEENAQVTLRIPVSSLTSAMESLASMGTLTRRRVSSEDVTEQYVDIDARLQTMVALRDRLRGLLDKAQDVKDILAIEKELTRVQADIDSMQARLKALKGQVDLAAISVSIQRKRILGPVGYVLKGAWWVVEKLFVIRK